MVSFLWLLWILLSLMNFALPIYECNGHLMKVLVLFRHGARTPLRPYKFYGTSDTDENSSEPESYGQLTLRGKNQLFELGQNLRKRYQDFLTPHNSSVRADVQVVTTESERCYQSAGFLLAGLYPPSVEQKWSEELDWQPIPIALNSPDRVKIIGDRHLCPVYDDDLQAVKIRANHTDPNIHDLLNFFSKHVSSARMSDVTDLFFLVDYFKSKEAMPEWIPKNIKSKMSNFYVDSFNYLTSTFRMRRLLTSTLIKDIILRIDEVVYKKESNSKFFLYSGHDSSLHTLGQTIGFRFDSVPYFGASIIFEIHQLSTNDFRIKLFYSPDYSLEKLNIWVLPSCEVLCPVRKFIELTEPYLSYDWKKECNTTLNAL